MGSWEVKSEKHFKDAMYIANFYEIAPNVFLEENSFEKKDSGYFQVGGRTFWAFDVEANLFYILKAIPSENLQYIMRFDDENKICHFLKFSSQNLEDLKKVQKGLLAWDAIASRAILELKFDGDKVIPKFEKYPGEMVFYLRFPESKIVRSTENKSFSREKFPYYFNENISELFEHPVLKVSSVEDLSAFTHVSGNLAFLIFYKGIDSVNFPSVDLKPISGGFNFTMNSFYIDFIKSADPVFIRREGVAHNEIISKNDTPIIIWRKHSWNIEKSMLSENRYFAGVKEGGYWVFYSTKEDCGYSDRGLFNRDEDNNIIPLKEGLVPYFKADFSNKKLNIIPLKR
ncbi:MAG: hypothetical protein J6P03_05835 [Opitutales bacterium]|nr:hypothetical protein [Opitutales bacterium]